MTVTADFIMQKLSTGTFHSAGFPSSIKVLKRQSFCPELREELKLHSTDKVQNSECISLHIQRRDMHSLKRSNLNLLVS